MVEREQNTENKRIYRDKIKGMTKNEQTNRKAKKKKRMNETKE